ncbi:sensor histidine kinase [Dactylosporangium sp. NPDC048998]|uniref:sensor histidine kinase n=1 Tax=Dactylosporangium sp. NPDC048998 TaxID=3363976 RepID=UPI00371D1940
MRWQVVDAAAAVAVLAVCGVAAQEAGRPSWWQWLLVCAVSVPVAVRNRWPLPAALVTLTASAAVLACGVIPPYAAPVLCAAVALIQYSVAVGMPPSRSVPMLATGLGGAVALGLLWPAAPLVAMPAVAVPWLVGWVVRHRRHLTERIADERTARAVTEERLRIARDMHDTVAHSLSMIAMKASVARHVAAVRPEESMTALEVIETASREALVEMRRAVGLLRADLDPAMPSGSDEDLRALADRAEQTGIQVELNLVAAAAPPAGVRLVVYRVVQEALTNVIRHAKATGCTVSVEAGADSVTVRVVDNGTAAVAPGGTGHGLRGMRERVAAYGGNVQAGPHPTGGFALSACIPYRPSGQDGQP